MKKLLFKIKTWFILRWKEIKSIYRDKKEIKMERQVRVVEFHKKHPTYTLFTRIFAVVFCLAFVAVGIVSCARTYKDAQEDITANADEISIDVISSENVAYSANDRFTLDLPAFPIRANALSGEDLNGDMFFVEYLFPFSVIFDVSHFEIYDFFIKDPEDSYAVFDNNEDISQLGYFWVGDGDIWYNDTGIYELSFEQYLDANDEPFIGSFGLFHHFNMFIESYDYRLVLQFYDINYNHHDYYFDIVQTEYIDIYSLYYFEYSSFEYSNFIYTSGFDVGYTDGLTDGRADGYNDGQRDGYDVGYQDGYDFGYSTGISTSLEDVTPWDLIVTGVNSFFGLSFLGNSVTIGMILSIGFGALLLGFAIKIFLGG